MSHLVKGTFKITNIPQWLNACRKLGATIRENTHVTFYRGRKSNVAYPYVVQFPGMEWTVGLEPQQDGGAVPTYDTFGAIGARLKQQLQLVHTAYLREMIEPIYIPQGFSITEKQTGEWLEMELERA